MTETHASGMAVGVIDRGKVGYVHTASAMLRATRLPLTLGVISKYLGDGFGLLSR